MNYRTDGYRRNLYFHVKSRIASVYNTTANIKTGGNVIKKLSAAVIPSHIYEL